MFFAVFRLHLLTIGSASFALDHSPCARMIWILTTILILLRRKNSSYRFQQWICPRAVRLQQVALFYLPSIHQISTLEKTNPCQLPLWVTWWVSVLDRSPCSQMLLSPWAQRSLTFISGSHRAFRCCGCKHVRIPFAASRDQIHHRLRFCCDFFFTWIFLRSFRHHFRTIDWTEMANVIQTQKMIPFITCEVSLGQYVCELVFGFSVFDMDFRVQIDSIK